MKRLLLIFILIIFSFSFALAQKQNLKPNKFLETQILKGPDFNLESNYAEFEFKGINFRNPNNNSNKEIKITNWQIKTSIVSFKIQKAIKDYHPNPFLRKEEDIILQPYGRVVITASISPLGYNFLGNQCFNYLNNLFAINYPVSFCDRLGYNREGILSLVLSGKIS
jgi:hypothetical protein